MLNMNLFLTKTWSRAGKYWQAALLLLAGILVSVACVVEVTPELDGGGTDPNEKDTQSADTGTPTTSLADKTQSGGTPVPSRDAVEHPVTETPEPQTSSLADKTDSGGTPAPNRNAVEYPVTETPEPQTTRRSVPATEPGTVLRIPNSPTPEPDVLLPKNTLALVMAVSGGSGSSTLKTIVNDSTSGAMIGTKFIQLESSSKSVLLYLPDTGETTVIDSYSSPSYAPHFKRPYTVDDRLYVSNKYTNGGQLTITEYDTADLSRESEWGTQSDALDPGYAVAGGQVYYNTGSTEQWSMSRGFYNAPGDYMRSPYADRWESSEMAKPDLGFQLVSGGNILYGAKLPSEADPITGVFTVDPVTGQPAEYYTTVFEIEDWNTYMGSSWRNVVIADRTAYWVGFLENGSRYSLEILAASLDDPNDYAIYEFAMPASDNEVNGFTSTIDADGGYVLIKPWYDGGDRSKILLFNTATETANIIDTGFHIVDAQMLFIEG